jgi:aminocarboxymuconate-semialdehyde decarboxylase
MENKTNPRKYLARTDNRKGVTPARFYVDSLVHDPDALRMLLKLFGAQRVALGSDYPFPLGEAHPGKLIESIKDLSSKQKTQLFSGTAREFLGLK